MQSTKTSTNHVQQLSLPELERLPANPSPDLQALARRRRELQGVELELAMRQVFKGWVRWHWCKTYELAVADPVTKRLLELTARRGP